MCLYTLHALTMCYSTRKNQTLFTAHLKRMIRVGDKHFLFDFFWQQIPLYKCLHFFSLEVVSVRLMKAKIQQKQRVKEWSKKTGWSYHHISCNCHCNFNTMRYGMAEKVNQANETWRRRRRGKVTQSRSMYVYIIKCNRIRTCFQFLCRYYYYLFVLFSHWILITNSICMDGYASMRAYD